MSKKAKHDDELEEVQTFDDVFDAIADTPAEAENLRARSTLMNEITSIISCREWSQAEAAARAGITAPRMNDLVRGRLSRFSLDALVNIASALGYRVRLKLETYPPQAVAVAA